MNIYPIVLPESSDHPTRSLPAIATRYEGFCGKGKLFHKIIPVIGVCGENFGLLTRHTYDVDNPSEHYRVSSNHVGMNLSHYLAWGMCSQSPFEWNCIVEDDAGFVGDPDSAASALGSVVATASAHEADIVLIGSCNSEDKPKTHIGGDVYDVRYPHCTHAYLLSRAAAIKLMMTQRKIFAPIDISLAMHSYPRMKVFTVLPRLVDQIGTEIRP